jgi:hypothetical protein
MFVLGGFFLFLVVPRGWGIDCILENAAGRWLHRAFWSMGPCEDWEVASRCGSSGVRVVQGGVLGRREAGETGDRGGDDDA